MRHVVVVLVFSLLSTLWGAELSQVKHYEILQDSPGVFLVKFNPKAYRPTVLQRKQYQPVLATEQIIFNTNYSWLNKPIGELWTNGSRIPTFPSKGVRPIFAMLNGRPYILPTRWSDGKTWIQQFDGTPHIDIAFEGGPYLHAWGDQYVTVGEYTKQGKFRDDVTRKTSHVVLGTLVSGKVVVGYYNTHSLNWIKGKWHELFGKTLDSAMNFDGGHSAGLWLYDPNAETKLRGRGLEPNKIIVGARFTRRA